MKICRKSGLLPMIFVSFLTVREGRMLAQTYKTLHSFQETDGRFPQSGLVLSGYTLYGVALDGGLYGRGSIFRINTGGTDYTNIYNFNTSNSSESAPDSALTLSDNTLYGTTEGDGNTGYGTVFEIKTSGSGFTNLHIFTASLPANTVYGTNADGTVPASIIISSNTLFGIAFTGGVSGYGCVFSVLTDGTEFTNLHSFTTLVNANNYGTNRDGALPNGGLILSSNILYGTTVEGGGSGNGTLFRINTDGTGFTNLHSFTAMKNNTNSDGANPQAGLVLSGNVLFGATSSGGSSASGTLFAVSSDGTHFTNLHSFSALSSYYPYTNGDGADPIASLTLSGKTLYGVANLGGSAGLGIAFAIRTDGNGFTNLHSFAGADEGANPYGGLILGGYVLYGTTGYGGSSDAGTLFSLSMAPKLAIKLEGNRVVLTWPTNSAGFDYSSFILQTTSNLDSTNWATVFSPPWRVDGQNTVTNIVADTQRFYRLSQ